MHSEINDCILRSIMKDFYKRFLMALRSSHVPVIAAINGAAIGAGMCLAMGGADIRVAHKKVIVILP